MAEQYIMTQKGYDEAVAKLKYLQTVKRQEIVERIAEARSHGDLSENAEYDAARNEQAANEGEIVDLDRLVIVHRDKVPELFNLFFFQTASFDYAPNFFDYACARVKVDRGVFAGLRALPVVTRREDFEREMVRVGVCE